MEEIYISENRLASLLKITPRYVRELFLNHKVKKGTYNFLPCLEEYLDQGEVSLNRIKAETAQFKLDVMKREYHHTEDIELFLGELTARIKSKVLSIPNKGARLVSGETDIAKIEAILKEFTDDILKELSDYKTFDILGDYYETKDQESI